MRSSVCFVLAALPIVSACAEHAPPPAKPPVATPVHSAMASAPAAPPALRLPANVKPSSYAVKMHMSPGEEAFSGTVEIALTVKTATDVISLHAGENLNVKEAKLAGKPAKIERVAEDRVNLSFDGPIAAASYTLTLTYDGKLPSRDGRGAYRQEELGAWYIYTQFESTDARRAFPCFDEPGFKTPYTITLEVPKDQAAFANTPQTGETMLPNGWKSVTFAPSKPLPSYLVAFAVGPFETVDAGKAGKNKTPIRIIVPKGKTAEAAYAAKTTGAVLEQLENYFGIPYPYEKLDHIAVPQKGGAMENPGLITYGTNTILGKPEEKSIRLERGYLSIAAHELGHIWTGDFVTTAWWDDIWLNEAFATWISAKIVDRMHPEWDGAVGRVQSKLGVMGTDSLVSTRKIRQSIESKHDIVNAFDGITYQKGGAVISMMEAFAGEENFRKGVHAYLSNHAHGNATSADFLAEVGKESGKGDAFAAAFSTFLDQPGVPLVTAELLCNGAPKLLLSQERYLPQGSSGGAEQTWKIPVCASFPGGKSCTLLDGAKGELPLETKTCPAWVNPNANANGYYRVDYKGDLLKNLFKAGKALSVHERMAIFGDAGALVRAGKLQDGVLLEQVPALVAEGNQHLTGLTAGTVGGLETHLVEAELKPNYKRFIAKTYGAKAKELGWTPKAGEKDETRILRQQIVPLVARDEASPAAAEARKLTEAYISDRKAIDHDLVGSVLWAGSRNGDAALWEKLHDAAKKAQDRKERGHLLGAMGSFRDPKIVEKNFAVAMSDEFDARESFTLVWGASGDPATRQMAYDFVKQNFDKITARMPREWGASLSGIAGGFCDAEHRADAEAFFKDKAPNFRGGPRSLAQTLESISLCTAQKSARQASVSAVLKKY